MCSQAERICSSAQAVDGNPAECSALVRFGAACCFLIVLLLLPGLVKQGCPSSVPPFSGSIKKHAACALRYDDEYAAYNAEDDWFDRATQTQRKIEA